MIPRPDPNFTRSAAQRRRAEREPREVGEFPQAREVYTACVHATFNDWLQVSLDGSPVLPGVPTVLAAKDWALRHDVEQYPALASVTLPSAAHDKLEVVVANVDDDEEVWELRPHGRYDVGRLVIVQRVPATGLNDPDTGAEIEYLVVTPAFWADTTGNLGEAGS
jgi:hypothetical protein